jgi:hypothetical protein
MNSNRLKNFNLLLTPLIYNVLLNVLNGATSAFNGCITLIGTVFEKNVKDGTSIPKTSQI